MARLQTLLYRVKVVICSFNLNSDLPKQVGDEVLNVNGHSVGSKSFTEVISILSMSQTLLLTIKSNDPKFQNPPVNPQPVQTVVTGRRQR